MKVIERATMPNGTEIQLEDWHEHNTSEYPILYGYTIGAYPVAQRTGKYRWVESGDKFRLSISVNNYNNYTDENVLSDYECLKSGEMVLEDLCNHFLNGEKDKWYLGMQTDYRP